jgi:phage baseplate assembly protein W
MNISFPFRMDPSGRTATSDHASHVREMIEQLLFTAPGERVNRPTFGSGLLQMVFQPTSPEIAAALQFTLQASIQQWLGDVLQVQSVQVNSKDSTLSISVAYLQRNSQTLQTATFTRGV